LKLKDRSALTSLNSLLENDSDIISEEGTNLRDWSDSSFELDPKDTASTRVKLFIASIRDVTFGTEREPSEIDLKFRTKELRDRINGKDKIHGRKTLTIRTPDQAEGLKIGGQYLTKIDGIKHRVHVEKVLTEEDFTDQELQTILAEEQIEAVPGSVLLRLEEWRPKKNVLVPKENFLGFAELVDFDDIFQKLLEVLHDEPNDLETYLEVLEREAKNFKPIFQEVANRLRQESNQVQREFIKVMSKQYQEFSILRHSRRRDGFIEMTPINANQGSAVQSILKSWRENQKNSRIVQRDAQGNLVINETEAQLLVDKLEMLQARYQAGETLHVTEDLKPFAREILEANGIILSEEALDYLLLNTAALTKGTSVAGGVQEQFKVNDAGLPIGMFSSIVMKLGGLLEDETLNELKDESSSELLNNNPLFSEKTTMKILAKVAYKFSTKVAAGSHYNSENKNIYAFGMNSFLSTSVNSLINDPDYRRKLTETHLGRHSWLLKQLNSSVQARENFGLQYVDGLKESYKKDAEGITRPSMSTREQLLFAMGQFQHQRSNLGNFVSLTHSDKSMTPLFTGIQKFDVGPGQELTASVQQAVWETFLGEYERVKAWYTGIVENGNLTKNQAYNLGGGLYYFIPQFNYDHLQDLVTQGVIGQEDLQLFWIDKGVPNTRTNIVDLKPLVLRLFDEQWLTPEINKLTDKLIAEGFNTGLVDYSYFKKNASKVGLTVSNQGKIFFNGAQLTMEEAMQAFLPWAAKDFVTNYFLFNTALSSLLYGDAALFFKGKEGMTDTQVVAATLQEYQKRLAGPIAPGQDPTWDSIDETYRAITLQDSERIHKELETLAKYQGAEINGTDAQELTTVAEHLYVMKALGLIKDKIYDEMIAKIVPGQYYEFTDPAHQAVIMQIMKPVSYSQDFSEVPGSTVIHYVKSSSMPLYPPMTEGFEIDKLRVMMEEQKIPRANFVSAKKVGTPAGKGLKIFDEEGNIDINLDMVSMSVQSIARSGLRIQQEVPYDELKDEILTGSQMNKIFLDDIDDKIFTLNGEELTGAQIRARKEGIRKQLITMQINEFSNKIGAEMVDGKLRILDKTKLLALLEEEAVARNYSPNDLLMIQRKVTKHLPDGSAVTDLAIPLFFNSAADRFESLILSLVKKVGQIYMPGKSFIQASSGGFKFKDKKTFESLTAQDKNKIVWVPGYNGETLSTMTPGSPAKVLVPFQFLVENAAGDKENVNIEDFLILDEAGNTVLDTQKIPKELLQLIGFRIPTQKQNSMLPLQVVGFIPANMGDTIIVPEAITKQMGSDFDVDKLYTYRRGYEYNKGTFTLTQKGFTTRLGADYGDYTELESRTIEMLEADKVERNKESKRFDSTTFRQYLAKAVREKYPDEKNIPTHKFYTGKDTKASLINEYFDIMWSVLTDEEMYSIVMQPLDNNDLKNEAARAQAVTTSSNFYSPTTQLEDYQSQKDAKVMVGITSQFVTFNSWVQDKNLFVGVIEQEDNDVDMDENGEPSSNYSYTPNGVRVVLEGESKARDMYKLSGKALTTITDETTGEVHTRTRVDDAVTIQNEVLDHAKNRTVDKLNLNLNTIHAAEALIALSSEDGTKASWKHAALFLRQPAIIRLSEELSRLGDSLSTTFETDLVNRTIEKLILEYQGEESLKDADTTIDIERLKTNLITPEKVYQAGMLKVFQRLNEIGKEMAKIQKVFNQDPKGPGKNMIEAFDSINNRQRVIDSTIISGVENLLASEQGFIHEKELGIVEDTLQDILPYAGIQAITAELLKVTGRKNFSVKVQREIVKSFKAYLFSNPELGLSDNSNADRYRLLYGNKEQKTLAQRVWDAQQDTKNYFLNRLQPQLATTPNTPSYVFYLASKTSVLDDQENMAAFVDGLADPKTKDLFEDLVRYSYVTGGYGGSFNFLRYIPADFLIALPFASKLQEISDKLPSAETVLAEFSNFVEQWIRHNPQLALKVSEGMMQGKDIPGEKFKLQIPNTLSHPVMSIVQKNPISGFVIYPKYLSYYNKDSNSWNLFRQSSNSNLEYIRIDTLGNNQIDEYTYSSEYERSIIIENMAYIKPHNEVVQLDQTIEEGEITKADSPILEALNTQPGVDLEFGTILGREFTIGLLADMSDNKKINPAIQGIALYLADVFGELPQLPLSLEFKKRNRGKTKEDYNGIIDTVTGHIKIILDSKSTLSDTARTLVHEAIHGLTSAFTMQTSNWQQQFPEAYEALQRVKEVQQEALEAVIATAAQEGYTVEQIQNTNATDDAMLAGYKNAYYMTKNFDEFMSGIWESKELQLILNFNKTKLNQKTTLLEKFLSLIEDFLQKIGKVLGVNIRKGSTLEEGLKRSMVFMESVRKLDRNLTRPGQIMQVISDTFFNGAAPMQNNVSAWLVDNEEEAKRITKEINSELPMYKANYLVGPKIVVTVHNRELYSINLAPKEREATNPIDKVYGKVQEQMSLIRASIAQNKKSPDVLRQNHLLANLRLLANDLKATQDIENIKKLADYQITWAQKVRDNFIEKNLPVSKNQIMTAFRIAMFLNPSSPMLASASSMLAVRVFRNPAFHLKNSGEYLVTKPQSAPSCINFS